MLAMVNQEYSRIHFETQRPRVAAHRPSAWSDMAFRRLAGAVIQQALTDLESDDPYTADNAALWLLEDGASWAEALGISAVVVREYVKNADMAKMSVSKTN